MKGFNYISKHKSSCYLHDIADRRSIFFLIIILTIIWSPTIISSLTVFPIWLAIVFIPISSFLSFNACVINHNHIHAPIFRHKLLNRITNHALGLAKGHSALSILEAHNLNHHKFHGGEGDWATPDLAESKQGLKRLAYYLWKASLEMKNGRNLMRKNKDNVASARLQKKIIEERLVLFLAILIGMWISPFIFLITAIIPWAIGMIMLVLINLFQHDGCDVSSKIHHSRNFIGKFGNWLLFNNGYHTIHHLKPSLRWSELPKAHNEMVEYFEVVPNQEKSLLYFIFSYYFKRRSS